MKENVLCLGSHPLGQPSHQYRGVDVLAEACYKVPCCTAGSLQSLGHPKLNRVLGLIGWSGKDGLMKFAEFGTQRTDISQAYQSQCIHHRYAKTPILLLVASYRLRFAAVVELSRWSKMIAKPFLMNSKVENMFRRSIMPNFHGWDQQIIQTCVSDTIPVKQEMVLWCSHGELQPEAVLVVILEPFPFYYTLKK